MLATWFLAWMCRELGDYDRARELSEENLLRGRAAGNERVQGLSLDALAMLAIDEGRPQEALALLEKAYSVNGNFGGSLEVALDLCRLARALAVDGRVESAARLLAKGEALCAEIGASPESWPVLEAKLEETLSSVRPQLDDATFTEAWEQGRALTPDEAVALALASLD
jgi:tetratricopeptide (TPR) repeat protein